MKLDEHSSHKMGILLRRMFRAWAHEHGGALRRPLEEVRRDIANTNAAVDKTLTAVNALKGDVYRLRKDGVWEDSYSTDQYKGYKAGGEDFSRESPPWYDEEYRDSSLLGHRVLREHYGRMMEGLGEAAAKDEDTWLEEQLRLEQDVLREVDEMESQIFREHGFIGNDEDEDDIASFPSLSELISGGMYPDFVSKPETSDLMAFNMLRRQFVGDDVQLSQEMTHPGSYIYQAEAPANHSASIPKAPDDANGHFAFEDAYPNFSNEEGLAWTTRNGGYAFPF